MYALEGGSLGFQIGGEATDLILLVMNDRGMVFGWGTGRVLKGNGYVPLMDVAMGIGGAVGGGFLMRSANIEGFAATIITTPAAVIGAAVVTILAGLANGRRISPVSFRSLRW